MTNDEGFFTGAYFFVGGSRVQCDFPQQKITSLQHYLSAVYASETEIL
jgi:hypothetical protein